jgi:aspartate racemase
MKTLGIVAHSAEGGALCFITACREGAQRLGPHRHPPIVERACRQADFYICPDRHRTGLVNRGLASR